MLKKRAVYDTTRRKEGESHSIEHFTKPAGRASPLHEHPNAQVLVVLEGRLDIHSEGETVSVFKGDAVYIPGDLPHIVSNPLDELSIGLDIFVPGRSFDFWKNRIQP